MDLLNKIELKMIEWQNGVRVLYKDLQEFHNWTDDQVWFELETELKKISSEGDFGEDDLSWTREILTSKRDIKTVEAIRLVIRFHNQTPLLDALNNLRFIKSRD